MHLILDKKPKKDIMRPTMPAKSPNIDGTVAARLVDVGAQLRAHRKRLRVSATTAAEAAGVSRVTLHRIERGEPSVTMGAYLSALSALGLDLRLAGLSVPAPSAADAQAPESVRLLDYPQLKNLAWQRRGDAVISAAEALSLYERHWRHLDTQSMTPKERDLVQQLVATLGGGRLLV
jgi:transcriptional regulator with XRE-family HTH domain